MYPFFSLLICLRYFDFQTQPGTLNELRKTVSSLILYNLDCKLLPVCERVFDLHEVKKERGAKLVPFNFFSVNSFVSETRLHIVRQLLLSRFAMPEYKRMNGR